MSPRFSRNVNLDLCSCHVRPLVARPSEYSSDSEGQVRAAWELLSVDVSHDFVLEGKLFATCKEIQVAKNITKDGDYDLNIEGRMVKVLWKPFLIDFNFEPVFGKCFLEICVFPVDPLLRHATGEP